MWKQQIRGLTTIWGRARPPGETTDGLTKRKKPKKNRWAGTIESGKSTGRLTGVMTWMRTFPGAQKFTLLPTLAEPRSLTDASSSRVITSQEKRSCPKRAGGASIRKRRGPWKMMTVTIYFLLSRGKKSLNCETVSDLAFQHVSGLTTFRQYFYYLWLNKVRFFGLGCFRLSHMESSWAKTIGNAVSNGLLGKKRERYA